MIAESVGHPLSYSTGAPLSQEIDGDGGPGAGVANLLLEDGDNLLLEDGGVILEEDGT